VASWLFLAVLVIIWAVCIFPRGGARSSPSSSVDQFERGLSLLADTGRVGRWIVAPRKGAQFVGPRERARARVRGRRRRILAFLLEATGISFLMALFPPLRPLVFAAGLFGFLLVTYVGLLLALRPGERELERRSRLVRAELQRMEPARAQIRTHRRPTRPAPQVIHLEDVHVTIRPARELASASAH